MSRDDEKRMSADDYQQEVLRGLGITRQPSEQEMESILAILASDDSAETKKNALLNVDIVNNEGIHPDIGWIGTISAIAKSLFG